MVRVIRLTTSSTRGEQAGLWRASWQKEWRSQEHRERGGIIASCGGNSDACSHHAGDKWRGTEQRPPATRPPHPSLICDCIGDTTFVAAWKQPSGDINGTTHFGAEAGAVSGPPDSIHLSALHIGTFPVYSLHHTLHLPTSRCSPSISLAAPPPPFSPRPIKTHAPSTPQWSIRGWFYGISPPLMAT